MKIIKKGNNHFQVSVLKKFLNAMDHALQVSNIFDQSTKDAVITYQAQNGLVADGIVGKKTWRSLFNQHLDIVIDNDISLFMDNNEYVKEYKEKKYIYLHHTVGSHKPDITISAWNDDNWGRVGTCYVIGGKKYNGNDDSFDGLLYKAFHPYHWAYHLGVNSLHNNINNPKAKKLNSESVGIEICSIGPLKKIGGEFRSVAYPNIRVQAEQVCDLRKKWRGYRYFHKYSEKQIRTCEKLILESAFIYDIPIRNFQYSREWFDLKYDAIFEEPGIWTHCNLRYDKTDCFPQPELIDMLNGLYSKYQDFHPSFDIRQASLTENSILRGPTSIGFEEEIMGSRDLTWGEIH